MKRLIIYLLVILSGTLLVGCPEVDYHITRSFVEEYYEVDDFEIVAGYKNTISIKGMKEGNYWKFYNSGSQKDKYDALCKKHNDMSWNKTSFRHCVLGVDFLSIDFVSDADFDETHSAGASLSDILRFESESLYPFVSGGYEGAEFGENYNRGEYTRINKPLSELTIDDMKMLGKDTHPNLLADRYYGPYIAYLFWLSEPTLSKTHNITVTMISDDGRTFEKTIQVSWE